MATGANEAEGCPRLIAASLPESFGTVPIPRQGAGFWRKFGAFAGPGYLVTVGFMDPGNWATDLAGGCLASLPKADLCSADGKCLLSTQSDIRALSRKRAAARWHRLARLMSTITADVSRAMRLKPGAAIHRAERSAPWSIGS